MTLLELFCWMISAAAVAGVILNNFRHRACFVLWLATNAATAAVHVHAGLYGFAARDLIFLALAVHGLHAWRRKRNVE